MPTKKVKRAFSHGGYTYVFTFESGDGGAQVLVCRRPVEYDHGGVEEEVQWEDIPLELRKVHRHFCTMGTNSLTANWSEDDRFPYHLRDYEDD